MKSMQKHCAQGMHKVHRDYKKVEERRDGLLLLRGIQECRRRRVQQLKCTEEEWCIEWTWHTEHKRRRTESVRDVCRRH
jgi:hypothetical protein